MAQQTLNDGVSFGEQRSKINSNFTELYSTKTTNSNAAITGGTINGAVIGGDTPAAGAFTTLSASGNLGVGVTPSAWWPTRQVLQFNAAASISSFIGGAGVEYRCNAFLNSSAQEIYQTSAAASMYLQLPGQHQWHTAPSGAAGQSIPFTQGMALTSAGLSVAGDISSTGKLTTAGIKEDSSGNVMAGTSTFSGNPLQGFILAPNNGETFLAIGHVSGTPSGGWYEKFSYNGASIGTITQSGTTSVAYNTTSDHRLKENIRPANAGRFNDIQFVDFEWIDDRHDCGVIAHQLQEIYPDLVIGEKDATEIRKVEITPAVPAVTEQKLVSEAIFNEDGEEIEPAVYETIEITPAVEAVFEDQEFPVYQQVNYIGLIGRMGTRIQMLDKLATEQVEVISKLEARLSAIEAKLN